MIEVRKNVIVMFNINLTGNLTYEINNVPFIPDEVNIRCINYASNNGGVEDGLLTRIYTDLVTDSIGTFFINGNPNQRTTFTLMKPVKGQYNLTLFDVNGAVDNLREGQLSIHFEFVKHSKPVY